MLLSFVLRRRIRAFTPFNRSHSENLRSLDHLSSFSVISMLCTTTLLTSRSSTDVVQVVGRSGHSVLGNDQKLGLIIQRCSKVHHQLDCGCSHHVEKQVESFFAFHLYFNTVVLSNQQNLLSTGSSNSLVIMFSTRAERAAAVSSRRGVVVVLTGATRAFPMRKAQWISPFSFVILR